MSIYDFSSKVFLFSKGHSYDFTHQGQLRELTIHYYFVSTVKGAAFLNSVIAVTNLSIAVNLIILGVG